MNCLLVLPSKNTVTPLTKVQTQTGLIYSWVRRKNRGQEVTFGNPLMGRDIIPYLYHGQSNLIITKTQSGNDNIHHFILAAAILEAATRTKKAAWSGRKYIESQKKKKKTLCRGLPPNLPLSTELCVSVRYYSGPWQGPPYRHTQKPLARNTFPSH